MKKLFLFLMVALLAAPLTLAFENHGKHDGQGPHGMFMDDDADFAAKTTYCFVDGIIYDLADKVVQALGTGGPDIHRRPFSDRVKTFEDFDCACVVGHSGPILK